MTVTARKPGRSFVSALLIMIFTPSLLAEESTSIEEKKLANREFFHVPVFGCEIRLSDNYVHSASDEQGRTYHSDSSIVGVGDYDDFEELIAKGKNITVFRETVVTEGRKLEVLLLDVSETMPAEDRDKSQYYAVIYDDTTGLGILGPDATAWRDILRPCIKE